MALRIGDHDFIAELQPHIVQDAASLSESLKEFTEIAKSFDDNAYPSAFGTARDLAGVLAKLVTDTLVDTDSLLRRVPQEQRADLRKALIRALAQVEGVTNPKH